MKKTFNTKKTLIIIVIAIVVIIAGWYLISPAFRVVESDEESPLDNLKSMPEGGVKDSIPQSQIIAQGEFIENAHEVEGNALLIDNQGGNKILRFEDFETINGPDLHIYLSSNLDNSDFIDLGEIKATKGSVNYEIPSGTDTEKYNKVLVWCVPFRVLFSYAELK